MPIRFRYDQQARILFTTAEGLVSLEEIHTHLDQEAARGQLGYREIFDALAATTNLTSGEVHHVVERVHAMMLDAPFGPTAVVATNDMFFGMARMFGILCQLRGGPQVAVFRTFDEGLDWLLRAAPQ
jgi:hypothetical protein